MITGGRVLGVSAKHLKDGKIEGLDLAMLLTNVKMDKGILVISYTSKITYRTGVAEIEVQGEVHADGSDSKKEFDEWTKTGGTSGGKFSNAFATELLKSIHYSTTAIGTLASFAIGIAA